MPFQTRYWDLLKSTAKPCHLFALAHVVVTFAAQTVVSLYQRAAKRTATPSAVGLPAPLIAPWQALLPALWPSFKCAPGLDYVVIHALPSSQGNAPYKPFLVP